MKKYLFILDAGHGGMIDGVYQTKGKRSPVWNDMSQLFEGEFTRSIVHRIIRWAPMFGIKCLDIVDSEEDISLAVRVKRANDQRHIYPDSELVYVSVHANAGGGHGIEVFTSPGHTRSDSIATVFLKKLSLAFSDARLRTDMSDGDPDKEAEFYVLKKTAMPAILTENFFMDNELECKRILQTESGRDKIALAHIAAMVEIDREVA